MAKKKTSGSKAAETDRNESIDFEAAMEEIQTIVEDLESGSLGLTESLQHYETGVKRLEQCHAALAAAEQRVRVLSGFDENGYAQTDPLPEGTTEPSKRPQSTQIQQAAAGPKAKRVPPGSDQAIDENQELF